MYMNCFRHGEQLVLHIIQKLAHSFASDHAHSQYEVQLQNKLQQKRYFLIRSSLPLVVPGKCTASSQATYQSYINTFSQTVAERIRLQLHEYKLQFTNSKCMDNTSITDQGSHRRIAIDITTKWSLTCIKSTLQLRLIMFLRLGLDIHVFFAAS